MKQIITLAVLTLRESLHRKTLAAFFGLGLLLVAASLSIRTLDESARGRIIENYSLIASSLSVIVILISTAAMSLPEDIRDKRILVVLSKPVPRWKILAGKWAGFCALSCLLLTVLFAATALALWRANADLRDASLRAIRPQSTSHRVADVEKTQKFGRYWLSDDELTDHCRWTFALDQQPRATIAGEIFYITPLMNRYDVQLQGVQARLVINNHELLIPLTGKKGSIVFEFPKEWVTQSGTVELSMYRSNASHPPLSVKLPASPADPQGAVLYPQRSNKLYCLFKSFILVWLNSVLLATATLGCSAFVGAPVAVFLGLSVLFAGSVAHFAGDSLNMIKQVREIRAQTATQQDAKPPEASVWQQWGIQAAETSLALVPDFHYFNPHPYLRLQWDIPPSQLKAALLHCVLYSLPFWVIGALVLQQKEWK